MTKKEPDDITLEEIRKFVAGPRAKEFYKKDVIFLLSLIDERERQILELRRIGTST